MLAKILLPMFNEIYGKSIHKASEELTGISERTWRDGGPKSKTKQEKLPSLIRVSLKNQLERNTALSKEAGTEVLDRFFDGKRDFLSSLIISFGELQGLSWPNTEKLALELDIQNSELTNLLQRKDFPASKKRINELCNEPPLKIWINSNNLTCSLLEKSANAENWHELDEILNCWVVHAIYKTLACWDLEFQTKYLNPEGATHNIEIRPLFHLLMPRTKPELGSGSIEEFSPRGVFHLPMRRVLEMSYCLAYFYRNQKFPDSSQMRRIDIDGWASESNKMRGDGNIAKIYRGTMGVTAQDFDDIWVSMCKKTNNEAPPMAPWPAYIAAQIWTHLYVTKTLYRGYRIASAIVTPGAGMYEYWWYHHHKQIEKKNLNCRVATWPKYLISQEASEANILKLLE